MHDLEIKTNKALYLLSCQYFRKGKEIITIRTTIDKGYTMEFIKNDDDGFFYKEPGENEYLQYIKNTYEHYIFKR